MELDSKRRKLIISTVALAAPLPAIAACPAPRPPAATLDAGGRQPLVPAQVRAKRLPLALDVHAHLFNATDVPVAGFLAGPVAHSWPALLRNVARTAAPFVERMALRFPVSCGEEVAELQALLARQGARGVAADAGSIRDEIDRSAGRRMDDIERELVRELPRSDLGRALDEADRRYQASALGVKSLARPLSRDPGRIAEALRRTGSGSMDAKANSGASRFDVAGVLTFIGAMLSLRHHNLRTFQKGYTEGDGAFGIAACFASLVDFDYWLGCERTASSMQDQLLVHEQLALLSGGYVLPVAAYNPWTDIVRDGESLRMVQDAVGKRGFVGVKVYPPMGFHPLDNQRIGSRKKRPSLAELDKRLAALYGWCVDQQVPVMAHTDHSMGRDHAHDSLSAPKWWDRVVTRYPGLRINAGHFGGDYQAGGEDWPRQFVQLMGTTRGAGVFADLGFAAGLFDPRSRAYARTADFLSGPLGAGQAGVHSRIMYGSDWLMLSRLPQWAGYPAAVERFVRALRGVDHEAALRSVYFDGAVRCFGLAKGARNRTRLERFYAERQVPPPAWLGVLDSQSAR